MFNKSLFLLVCILGLTSLAHAKTAEDELREIDNAKTQRNTESQFPPGTAVTPHVRQSRITRLSDGTKADLSDYAFVVFMQQHCPYSAKFDPKLKALATDTGIHAYAYTLDGGGDDSFPHPMIPTRRNDSETIAGEILVFFGNGLPIATPTTFLVNVNTNKAYPLVQGDTSPAQIMNRVNDVILFDKGRISQSQLGAVPAGHTTGGNGF